MSCAEASFIVPWFTSTAALSCLGLQMTLQPRTGTVLHGSLQSATKLGHFCAACRQRQACRNQGTFKVFAMETRNRQANQQARRQSRKKGELPQTGFFAQADPKGDSTHHEPASAEISAVIADMLPFCSTSVYSKRRAG